MSKTKIMKRERGIRVLGFVLLVIVGALLLPMLLAAVVPGMLLATAPLVVPNKKDDDDDDSFEGKVLRGVSGLQAKIAELEQKLASGEGDATKLKEAINDLSAKMLAFQKSQQQMKRGLVRPGQVSDECARHLGGIIALASYNQGFARNSKTEGMIKDILGLEVRSALTTSDIPLPEAYGSEVVELVSQYGLARRFGTIYPLGSTVTKLPRLKTSTAFGLIAASGTVTEVSPQTEWVTFTAEKFGGLVRLPSEIDEDSIFAMGQFLARYTAREIAKAEDTQFWVGTGAASGVNGTAKGLTALVSDNSKTTGVAAGGGKTAYSDTTLTVLRAVRAVVDEAAIKNGAYYFHRSFEQFLSNLNTAGDKPYLAARGGESATLDGFPINWVAVLPTYSTSANAGKVYGLFGDASYMYLGVRGGVRFDTSREAAFATDEILVRALERMTVGLMATGAMGGLKTPAN